MRRIISPTTRYSYLWNSYYQHAGARWERSRRGLLSRPTVQEVYAYRAVIDDHLCQLIDTLDTSQWPEMQNRIVLGLHHEQQHQELLVTDIRYILATNPLHPAYHVVPDTASASAVPAARFVAFAGGTYEIAYLGGGLLLR